LIRESLYFTFAGRKSSEFGILNVSVSDGLYSETFMASRTINEVKIRGREKPYFFEVNKEPLSFQLSFSFKEGWDNKLIAEVERWLDVDFYQPLSFSENFDKVYYVMPVESTELLHNGLKQGYITLTMRCDSPYSYGRDHVTPLYTCIDTKGGTFATPYQFIPDDKVDGTFIEIFNYGQKDILPFITIQKDGDGDIIVRNMSRANSVMTFSSLLDGETVSINGENEIIETSLPNTWRYNNFNDYYLPFFVGKNIIKVEGNCKIKFQYRYKYIS
jgi:phage-related protein